MRLRTVLYLAISGMTLSCSHNKPVSSQESTVEEAAVLMAVGQFFETMASRDVDGARAVLDPEGDFVNVRWNDDGERVVRRSSIEDYLNRLGTGTDAYLERMWESEVRVHGPIAFVWTPYDFHINGKPSHCGVDGFQLLQTDAGWIITGGTYTIERTGCGKSPLGPPTER